ncbi:MAG: response regulator [Sphingobacteriales bacterium]|nr:MAG: response regulator [Sphingobacteriales bacterium]
MAKMLNLMLVDDSRIILNRLSAQLLEMKNIAKVVKANTFQKAVDVLENEVIDVALLDINLPGKNGIDLLEHITKNFPHIKTIMVTNQGSDHYRATCAELGSFGFIDKSREIEKLPSLIFQAAL